MLLDLVLEEWDTVIEYLMHNVHVRVDSNGTLFHQRLFLVNLTNNIMITNELVGGNSELDLKFKFRVDVSYKDSSITSYPIYPDHFLPTPLFMDLDAEQIMRPSLRNLRCYLTIVEAVEKADIYDFLGALNGEEPVSEEFIDRVIVPRLKTIIEGYITSFPYNRKRIKLVKYG